MTSEVLTYSGTTYPWLGKTFAWWPTEIFEIRRSRNGVSYWHPLGLVWLRTVLWVRNGATGEVFHFLPERIEEKP